MAKYGTGTNTMMEDSAKPLERDRHALGSCLADHEQVVFKWSTRTGVEWLSQLCDEAGTHPRKEALSRMLSSTLVRHTAAGAETATAFLLFLNLSSLT